ncbi:hypothetical protein [Nocardia sp. CNY236]|nr:hypothetical protein [Nocardia sp. CNY236]
MMNSAYLCRTVGPAADAQENTGPEFHESVWVTERAQDEMP